MSKISHQQAIQKSAAEIPKRHKNRNSVHSVFQRSFHELHHKQSQIHFNNGQNRSEAFTSQSKEL